MYYNGNFSYIVSPQNVLGDMQKTLDIQVYLYVLTVKIELKTQN